MGSPFWLMDAFVDGPFSGNPAAVVRLDGPADAGWMQSVAAEMNQAETAFLWPLGEAWSLRWFTPTVEVDLCGHATLASAWALGGEVQEFETRSGRLVTHRRGDEIEMDFPAEPPSPCEPPPGLLDLLPSVPVFVGRNRMDWVAVLEGGLVETDWTARMPAIRALGMRGLLVSAPGGGDVDFVSRCFFPQSGVDEDPATGSAHCALAPYWAERLGRTDLRARQLSPRGAAIGCRVAGDRVLLTGRARTVVTGELTC